jgi:LAO/AO transport system kinase
MKKRWPLDLIDPILSGNPRAISKAITLVESGNPDDQKWSTELLQHLPKSEKTFRIGLSGPPGAGKSTLIEVLGLQLIDRGYRVAVLAIDPTSPTSGGALLGDKTRMTKLSRSSAAFIRPSSSTKHFLGGLSPHTPDIISVLEAAGFNIILIETIGIGQNEIDVFDVVDMVLLLLSPGAGDELQGLKKGILDLVHMVIVNKWDNDLIAACEKTAQHYRSALMTTSPNPDGWIPPVLKCSAQTNEGINDIWDQIETFYHKLGHTIYTLRQRQQEIYLEKLVQHQLLHFIQNHPSYQEKIQQLVSLMEHNNLTARQACSLFMNNLTIKIDDSLKSNV